MVDVALIDFEHRYITWFDGQYSRDYPEPSKLYEMVNFDDCNIFVGMDMFGGFVDYKTVEFFEPKEGENERD